MTTKLLFPFPPSLNSLYPTNTRTGRRFKSKRYGEWEKLASYGYNGFSPITTPVKITLAFGRPDKRKRDLDGLFKGPFDLLVKLRVIADDSLIHEIHASWSGAPGFVEIEITELACNPNQDE